MINKPDLLEKALEDSTNKVSLTESELRFKNEVLMNSLSRGMGDSLSITGLNTFIERCEFYDVQIKSIETCPEHGYQASTIHFEDYCTDYEPRWVSSYMLDIEEEENITSHILTHIIIDPMTLTKWEAGILDW